MPLFKTMWASFDFNYKIDHICYICYNTHRGIYNLTFFWEHNELQNTVELQSVLNVNFATTGLTLWQVTDNKPILIDNRREMLAEGLP